MSCEDCATNFDLAYDMVTKRYADLLAAAEGVMGDEPDLSHCPYFKGTGQCSSGCSSEPSCQTDRPLNGWPKERLAAAIKKAKGQQQDDGGCPICDGTGWRPCNSHFGV